MSKYQIKDLNLAVKKCNTGRGLFAQEDIPKNVCITEYLGKELTTKEEYKSKSKYLFAVNTRLTIDGYIPGNIARFINYACKPNSEYVVYKRKVFVFTRKKVKKGDEITIDYGREYYDEHIKKSGCLCKDCFN
jgi:uncharacterized protein